MIKLIKGSQRRELFWKFVEQLGWNLTQKVSVGVRIGLVEGLRRETTDLLRVALP